MACISSSTLQSELRLSPALASVVVGILWAVWHFPLFLPGPEVRPPGVPSHSYYPLKHCFVFACEL